MMATTTFSSRSDLGLTLIEVLMTLVLLSILTFASLELVNDSVEEGRYAQTAQKLEQIRVALIGDPMVRENGVRTSFGFAGDVGQLPDSTQGLAALLARPSVSPTVEVLEYQVSAEARIGAGWNGPYLTSTVGTSTALKDAWGNDIVYIPASSPSPTYVKSYGADGKDDSVGDLTGYNKDLVVEIPDELWKGTVYGYINNRGSPFLGATTVTLYYPNPTPVVTSEDFVLPDYTVSTPSPGDPVAQFSFTDVAFGKRSIRVRADMPSPTPTITIGPVIFTMDRKNLELNEDSFDISNQ